MLKFTSSVECFNDLLSRSCVECVETDNEEDSADTETAGRCRS